MDDNLVSPPENTIVEIKLPDDFPENPSPDYSARISIKFIRGTPHGDIEGYKSWIRDTFEEEESRTSYVCDVCDKEYETMDDMNSEKCIRCMRYYDYCKTHVSVSECPFCNQ